MFYKMFTRFFVPWVVWQELKLQCTWAHAAQRLGDQLYELQMVMKDRQESAVMHSFRIISNLSLQATTIARATLDPTRRLQGCGGSRIHFAHSCASCTRVAFSDKGTVWSVSTGIRCIERRDDGPKNTATWQGGQQAVEKVQKKSEKQYWSLRSLSKSKLEVCK